jgi:hypothetical protein
VLWVRSPLRRLQFPRAASTAEKGASTATYYVQFAAPEEPGRWHTVARIDDRRLAEEMARIAGASYMRTTVRSRFAGRAVSRSALRREGGLQHAEWELGFGRFREYGEGVRARAEELLRARAPD